MSVARFPPLSTPLRHYVGLPLSSPIYTATTPCRLPAFSPYLHRDDTMSSCRFLPLSALLGRYVNFPFSPPGLIYTATTFTLRRSPVFPPIYAAKKPCRPPVFSPNHTIRTFDYVDLPLSPPT